MRMPTLEAPTAFERKVASSPLLVLVARMANWTSLPATALQSVTLFQRERSTPRAMAPIEIVDWDAEESPWVTALTP